MTGRSLVARGFCLALAVAVTAVRIGAEEPPPSGPPAAVVDLTTREGTALVGGVWRYHDATIIDVEFRAPGPDLKPSGPPNRTNDIAPRAGAAGFDDSGWEILDPTTLPARRSTGRLCFNWYRIKVTLPEQVDGFATAGSTAVFEIVVDDYAEVWVDGALPRVLGQSGGSLIRGWNAPNRVLLGRDLRPGQTFQIAVFGINGPISDPPPNFIWVRSAKVEFHAAPAAGPIEASSPHAAPAGPAGRAAPERGAIERIDPRLDALVGPDAALETIAEGHAWLEGPVWDRGNGRLLFSDIPANSVFGWAEGAGVSLFLRPSGYSGAAPFRGREPGSNGLTIDPSGRLVLCEHGDRRIARLESDGTKTTLVHRFEGKRLNSPNDAVYDSKGNLYFTDPPFGLPGAFEDPAREIPFSGVYRLSKEGVLSLLTGEIRAPNGIALSPSEETLYVSNADPQDPFWMAFDLRSDGSLASGRIFSRPPESARGRRGGPDGIKVDLLGNLFTAGPGGVYVFAPDGAHLGTILTGAATSNIAWGGDGSDLYITASTAVHRIRLNTKGAGPWPGSIVSGGRRLDRE